MHVRCLASCISERKSLLSDQHPHYHVNIPHTHTPSPVHSEGDQPWDFFGRNDAKAETPVLWPPHVKSWRIGKDSDAGRDWGQEEKGTTEDEMAGWHHQLDGGEFEWTPGVGDGQGGLACCSSWGPKDSNTTEWLNWLEQLHASSLLCFKQGQNIMCRNKQKIGIVSKDGIQPPKLEIITLFINLWGNIIANFEKLKPELSGNICFR